MDIHENHKFPLVSCIMPTYNRRVFVPHAIKYFLNQDYPNKELVIVDEGKENVMDLIPEDERIKYILLKQRLSIGRTRNLAVEQSKGTFIAHWDDDDWCAKNRLSYQMQPLIEGKADVCGIDTGIFYDILEDTFWTCDPEFHARMFYADIHGGSFVYRRELWEKYARYPDISLAEDAAFLKAISKLARIVRLSNKNVLIYKSWGQGVEKTRAL
jgi:glycosyltransferase involved in cell wall biosynthesis